MTSGTDATAVQDTDTTGDRPGAAPPPLRLSRTVPASPAHVWDVLVSADGVAALFGSGASIGAKGQAYLADDGSRGVVRSIHPLEQLRVSWHASPDAPAHMIEVDLDPAGSGTTLELLIESPSAAELERFRTGLDAVCALMT